MGRIFDITQLKKNYKSIIFLSILSILLIFIDLFKDNENFILSKLKDGEIDVNGLIINEIMSYNTGAYLDNNGNTSDWIEIYNGTNKDIELSNYGLSDEQDGLIKWIFPKKVLKSHEYLIVSLTGEKSNGMCADFSLKKDGGEYITLKSIKGKVIDSVKVNSIEKNNVMARDLNGKWIVTDEITPGYSNNKDGRKLYLDNLYKENENLIINEFLPRNKGVILINGKLDEYVELLNNTDKVINLKDYYISNDINVPFKWKLPDVKIEPKQVYLLTESIMIDNNEEGFHLDNEEGLVLLSHDGHIEQEIQYDNLTNGYSYVYDTKNYILTNNISPGYENTKDGINTFNEENRYMKDELIINEVMPYNKKYLVQSDNYYDWIELYNNTNHDINLGEYTLSNDELVTDKYKFPNKKLKSHEYFILLATNDKNNTIKDYDYVNFNISSEESLYLYKNNELVDSMFVVGKKDYSYGLSSSTGIYYFKEPTPGSKNDEKSKISLSYTPSFDIKPGIYNNSSIEVKLEGLGDIYYTLDGSIPTLKSKKYTGPIKLDKTTVIRMRSYSSDSTESDVVTGTYIINEKHTLPVLSLSLPDESFDKLNDNLDDSITVNAHAELYEEKDSFSIDCGMKLFGGQTRYIPKKSFALKFSSKYGPSKLKYKVFDNRDYTKFDTLVVRSGSQDSTGSMFRDELATSIMDDYGTVDVQSYKAVVLYINAKYWGVYFLREKVDEKFISQKYNVDESSTNIVRIDNVITTGSPKDYNAILNYIKQHDMKKDESYNYVKQKLDIDNFIDYLIGELFTTNNDIVNTRYFNNPDIDGGKLKMIFYDFDYGFYNYSKDYLKWLTNKNGLGNHSYNNVIIRGLFQNNQFKERFLQRLSYNLKNVWSLENLEKRYNELFNLIKPEMKRNQERWNSTYSKWEEECNELKSYITKRRKYLLENVEQYFDLSEEEMKKYFG